MQKPKGCAFVSANSIKVTEAGLVNVTMRLAGTVGDNLITSSTCWLAMDSLTAH